MVEAQRWSEAPAAPGARVMIPLIRGQSAASLLSVGDAIAARCPQRGVVLSLVEIPSRWTEVATSAVTRSRELLRWIAANDYIDGTLTGCLGVQSRFTANPATNIAEAMLESGCDLAVLEYPSDESRRRHRLEVILRTLAERREHGLVVVRPDRGPGGREVRPRSVLVPLRGGANASLALRIGLAIAARAGSTLTLLHVYDLRHHPDLRRHEASVFHELAGQAAARRPDVVELFSDRPNDTLLAVCRDYDAVVMGAHADPRRTLLIGSQMPALMERLNQTVIVTRAGADPSTTAA